MFKFYKNPVKNILVSVSLASMLIFATFFFGGNYSLFLTPHYHICFIAILTLWIIIFQINIKVYQFIMSSSVFKSYYLRLAIGLAVLFLLFIMALFSLSLFNDVAVHNLDFFKSVNKQVLKNYMASPTLLLIVITVVFGFFSYKWLNKQQNKLKAQKIIAGTANAKFESLKNQIDPHFLFNSLNVLSALIEENPANAQRFTTSLSKIYRYVLEQKDKELVSVQEELEFAKTYMNLLKMRFESSISFELPENFEQSEAKVVPLSLQLLLENGIKHNVVSEQKPLHIKIFEKDNFLVVQNDLQKKAVLQDGQGVGLQNIISRYAILTDRKVIVQQSNTVFSVHLPILTKQISIMKDTETTPNTAYYRAKKRVEDLKHFMPILFLIVV